MLIELTQRDWGQDNGIENRGQSPHEHRIAQSDANSNIPEMSSKHRFFSPFDDRICGISASFWFQFFTAAHNDSTMEDQKADVQNDNDVNNTGSNASIDNDSGDEPNALAEDTTLASFDSNHSNGMSDAGNNGIASSLPSPMDRQRDSVRRQARVPKIEQNQSHRFMCKRCKYGTNTKGNLSIHKKIHAREELMGLKRDRDGLLHCTSCKLNFKYLKGYCTHMKKFHNG